MKQPSFNEQLQEVSAHYTAGDFDLAHRRLLDCVIETANIPLFEKAIQYCDWLEANANTTGQETIRAEALKLLDEMQRIPVKNCWSENNALVAADSISKQYKRGNFSLNNISLTLNKGEIIGLVGENGNGKTTLMRMLACDIRVDNGKLSYYFTKEKGSMYDLRSHLLYVPQRIPRWWGSLMENLQFTLAHEGVKGESNLPWAEIMVARLGLRPYRNMTWNRLSSGYRTRFELAKTLLRNPQILLLDEPLANLDINAQQTILQDLKFLSRSISRPFGMVISSQHIYEVEKVSDSIIFLKNGEAKMQEQAVVTSSEMPVAEQFILELEANANRAEILSLFSNTGVQKVQYNGNVFIVYFDAGTTMPKVLSALAQSSIEVNYLRDISRSTRRFFAN